jgi:hypothetical protein
MIAVLLGITIGKEAPVPFLLPGVILILTGLFQMLYGDLLYKKFRSSKKNI